MAPNLEELLKTIPQQPQRQDSSSDQLAELLLFANRLGLYDAADVIKNLSPRYKPASSCK